MSGWSNWQATNKEVPLLSGNEGSSGIRGRAAIITDNQIPTLQIDPDFAYSDGNIELQILGHKFWVHEFLLTKFAKITELIQEARNGGSVPERRVIIHIQNAGEVQYVDFRNTFRVIYSSINWFLGPAPSFDAETLISTLRVATLFQNPDLRNFAISQLDSNPSYATAIGRIALSDELKLPDWEAPAFAELCRRPEPISPEEASILGVARFAEIVGIREAEQRRQFLELVNRVATDPFLDINGVIMKDKLQSTAEKTLKSSLLLACNCKAQNHSARVHLPALPVARQLLSTSPELVSTPAPEPTKPASEPVEELELRSVASPAVEPAAEPVVEVEPVAVAVVEPEPEPPREAESTRRQTASMTPFEQRMSALSARVIISLPPASTPPTIVPTPESKTAPSKPVLPPTTPAFGFSFGSRRFATPIVASQPVTIPESSPLNVTCQIHQLAPSIASESRVLYKHLSNTLERIEALKHTVSARSQGLAGGDRGYSIEDELKEASWVRKAI